MKLRPYQPINQLMPKLDVSKHPYCVFDKDGKFLARFSNEQTAAHTAIFGHSRDTGAYVEAMIGSCIITMSPSECYAAMAHRSN